MFFVLLQVLGTSSSPGPTGRYLYGSVGAGKTMLMDIFYDDVKVEKKLRTHFNSFMLDVHASKSLTGICFVGKLLNLAKI